MTLSEEQKAFRRYVSELARKFAPRYGVDWRVMAAAAILESGWGESELAREANNYFGITALKSTPGEKVFMVVSKSGSRRFRRYASVEESFDAYGRLVGTSSYYAGARKASRQAFVAALAPVYCPDDANYPLKMMQIMDLLD
jgi:flagellar protein FlgJ